MMRLIAAVVLLWAGIALAGDTSPRARALFVQTRCPVCAGQTIDESTTEMAAAMRGFIDAQIAAGASDQQIVEALRDKYGDAVLTRPAWHGYGLVAWAVPLVLMLLAGGWIWRHR